LPCRRKGVSGENARYGVRRGKKVTGDQVYAAEAVQGHRT